MKRERPNSEPYHWLAQYYDRVFTYHHGWTAAAQKKILGPILPKVRSACDLACGTGTTALALAAKGIRVSGVDLSPRMCRAARKKARKAGSGRKGKGQRGRIY